MLLLFLRGHDIDPTGFAKLRHVTISMHVTSSFRCSGSNFKAKCFYQLLAWKCLKSVMWLGSILFLNTLAMLTISHAVTNPIGPSRLQVCYGCLTMLKVWKLYPKTTVYIDLRILHSNCLICLQCIATMHQLK